ncbi:hypothetical protein MNB_SUP05-SYMBIONT-5-1021 [hydrothermal vent metagenome]|uniref:Uncharacterized protein n=1 Tax=hydrothermal vent metagenome TaxID=652676 RepID=A0A1W1E305_9ZZZZ
MCHIVTVIYAYLRLKFSLWNFAILIQKHSVNHGCRVDGNLCYIFGDFHTF